MTPFTRCPPGWPPKAGAAWFNRARYDADQIAAAFAARLKDTVDLNSVRDDLTGIVSRALEPTHVSVWISRPQGRS